MCYNFESETFPSNGLREPGEVDMSRRSAAFIAALAACGLVAAFSFAAEKAVESMWASGPMTIDGVAQEWEASTPIIDEGSNVEYALRNDGRNLYIIMVFKNPMYKSTLDYTGMKIYFTTGTKKSKDFGILFQKKMFTAAALIANQEKQGRVLTEEQKAEIRKKETHIVFTEEVLKPKKAVAPAEQAAESDPPVFRTVEKGRLSVCEFRIPLNRVNLSGGIDAKPGQSILLGFEWGGMTSQIMKDMMAGRADGSVSARDRGVTSDSGFGSGVGGDEAGGEIRGMGGGVGEMGRDPRYMKHSFWIEAKLATGGN
jgi:hypothetical protein